MYISPYRQDDPRRVANLKLCPLRQTPEVINPTNFQLDLPTSFGSTGSKSGVSHWLSKRLLPARDTGPSLIWNYQGLGQLWSTTKILDGGRLNRLARTDWNQSDGIWWLYDDIWWWFSLARQRERVGMSDISDALIKQHLLQPIVVN